MAAGECNLYIDQGADVEIPITVYNPDGVTPVDLTGYTARMQAREKIDDDDPFLELTTANSRITIDGPAGLVTLIFPAATTAALTKYSGFYDLELVNGAGKVERLIYGTFVIRREVTR